MAVRGLALVQSRLLQVQPQAGSNGLSAKEVCERRQLPSGSAWLMSAKKTVRSDPAKLAQVLGVTLLALAKRRSSASSFGVPPTRNWQGGGD